MVHVPHVLYHWRSHAASSSHLPTQNPGTIVSTRVVLERIVAAQSSPSHYEIAEFPIHRGAIEWWIRRRPIGDPSFSVVLLGADERSCAAPAGSDSLARARSVVTIPGLMETLDDWRTLGELLPRDILIGLFARYPASRRVIIGWVAIIALITFTRLGNRTELALFVMSAAMLYHLQVRPISPHAVATGVAVGVTLFIAWPGQKRVVRE